MNSEKYTYTDITEVANGAFGTLYRAVQRDKPAGKPLRVIALKKVLEKQATERSITESDPVREARNLSLLEGAANIVQLYDFFKLDAYHFIVMEFAPVSLA